MTQGIVEDVDITKIRKSYLFRRPGGEGDITDLSKSIKEMGLLQPIIVRHVEHELDDLEHYFEIVAGNRRYEACKSLGRRKITCHIVNIDIKEGFELSLVENIQRKSLDPIEEATAFKTYILDYGWGGISHLASKIGRSTSYIDKRIRLLDLPTSIIQSIVNSEISPSTAEELLPIQDNDKKSELAKIIRDRRLSTTKTRSLVSSKQYDEIYPHRLPAIKPDETQACRAFDKSILILNLTLRKLDNVIEQVEENWIIYEILMQHKRMIHAQVDLLIKEKRKSHMYGCFKYCSNSSDLSGSSIEGQ